MGKPISEDKKQKLFQEMSKVIGKGINAWLKLRVSQRRYEKVQDKLKELGLWEEYCKIHDWSKEAKFWDLGA